MMLAFVVPEEFVSDAVSSDESVPGWVVSKCVVPGSVAPNCFAVTWFVSNSVLLDFITAVVVFIVLDVWQEISLAKMGEKVK